MFRKLLLSILLLYGLTILVSIFLEEDSLQWDFKTYYYAGKAYASGLNPYDSKVLSQLAHTPVKQFFYPPISLPLFKFLPAFTFEQARNLFLLLKLIILAGLIYLWKREFLNGEADLLFYVFCLFGFNGAIYLDFRAGNISIIEQGVLWLAFMSFLRGRLLLFSLLTLFAATFKVQPILFLVLLGFTAEKRKYLFLGTAISLVVGVHLLSYWFHPEFFVNFISQSSILDERGINNPSTLSLLRDVKDALGRKWIEFISPTTIYLIIVMIVLGLTSWSLRSHRKGMDKKILLYTLCITYAIIIPRFKDYSYILLLVPAYSLLKRMAPTESFPLLIILFMFSQHFLIPGFDELTELILWQYYPLILTSCLWLFTMVSILQGRTGILSPMAVAPGIPRDT